MNATESPTQDNALAKRFMLALEPAVARTMAVISGKAPSIETGNGRWEGEGIASVIAYDGDSRFALALCLPRSTAEAISRAFAGVSIDWSTEMMDDIVGELANVLAGDLAAELRNHGLKVQMALPRGERTLDLDVLNPGAVPLVDLTVRGREGIYRVAILTGGEGGESS